MALLAAAFAGDAVATQALLGDPATDPNETDEKGCTALHAAASCNETAVLKLLLADARVDRAACAKYQMTATHHAAASNAVDALAVLVADAPVDLIDRPNEWGETPLHLAAAAGNHKAIRLLLASRADAQQVDHWGRDASRIAQEQGLNAEDLGLPKAHALNESDVGPSERSDAAGPFPPTCAAAMRDELTQILTSKRTYRHEVVASDGLPDGSRIEEGGSTSTTGLCNALIQENQPCGSSGQQSSRSRFPALSKYCEYPGDVTELRRLLEQGDVDPSGRDMFGLSALHKFCAWDRPELIGVLLPWLSHEDLNLAAGPSHCRASPLHLAAEAGATRAVRVLLGQDGLDKLAKDDKGRAPIDLAKQEGHEHVVALLSHEADR